MNRSRIPDLLGIRYPIIQGVTGGKHIALAAAVSEAGGLGTMHGGTIARESREKSMVGERIREIRKLTQNPFSINIPIALPTLSKDMVQGLINGAIEGGMKVVTTSAGDPKMYTQCLKEANIKVLHVVATVKQAVRAADAGVDAVIASGFEAGGWQSREEVTTFTLIPQVVDALRGSIPVIAAGGIGDARGLLAAFSLGAEGIQMCTRFLASTESSTDEGWLEAILKAGDDSTEIIGRDAGPARNFKIDFLNKVRPGYTRPAAGPLGASGQVSGLIKEVLSVEEIIRRIIDGIGAEYQRLSEELAPFMPS